MGRVAVPLVKLKWRCSNCGSHLTDSVGQRTASDATGQLTGRIGTPPMPKLAALIRDGRGDVPLVQLR
jgi:PHP family Zn ribbon phosphoesterase